MGSKATRSKPKALSPKAAELDLELRAAISPRVDDRCLCGIELAGNERCAVVGGSERASGTSLSQGRRSGRRKLIVREGAGYGLRGWE